MWLYLLPFPRFSEILAKNCEFFRSRRPRWMVSIGMCKGAWAQENYRMMGLTDSGKGLMMCLVLVVLSTEACTSVTDDGHRSTVLVPRLRIASHGNKLILLVSETICVSWWLRWNICPHCQCQMWNLHLYSAVISISTALGVLSRSWLSRLQQLSEATASAERKSSETDGRVSVWLMQTVPRLSSDQLLVDDAVAQRRRRVGRMSIYATDVDATLLWLGSERVLQTNHINHGFR